jgi:hypothetical protein
MIGAELSQLAKMIEALRYEMRRHGAEGIFAGYLRSLPLVN